MRAFKTSIFSVACAFTVALVASPAVAGHKHGGHYGYGGYAMADKKAYPTYQRRSYAHCRGKYRAYGRGHGMKGSYWHHPKRAYRHGQKGAARGYGYGTGGQFGGPAGGHAGGYSKPDGSAAAPAQPSAPKDIVSVATAAGNFSTLIAAVEAAGLADTLAGEGPFTVLAPSDAAFGQLPKEQVDGLLNDTEALKKVLTYHVIAGALSAGDLLEQGEAKTVNGAKVSLAQLDVAQADIKPSNGIIHVLDKVLIPAE